MSPKTDTRKSAKRTNAKREGFTAEERAAMRERVKEMKAAQNKEEGEREVLAKIAAMEDADRVMAERVHEIVTTTAPDLSPRTWYGMPAYARDGKIICYFRDAKKFKTRYATFGFSDKANLDDGAMWPTDYALMKVTAKEEKEIAALVKKAIS